MTSWIPENIAKLNKTVRLKNDDGTWDEGWKVVKVFSRMEESMVRIKNRQHKHHRKVTDI